MQLKFNEEHGITPQAIIKARNLIIGKEVDEIDIDNDNRSKRSKGKKYEFTGTGGISDELKRQCQAEFMPAAGIAADPVVKYMGRNEMEKAIERLRTDMVAAAKRMDFIEAAQLRDQLLKMEERLKQLQ